MVKEKKVGFLAAVDQDIVRAIIAKIREAPQIWDKDDQKYIRNNHERSQLFIKIANDIKEETEKEVLGKSLGEEFMRIIIKEERGRTSFWGNFFPDF